MERSSNNSSSQFNTPNATSFTGVLLWGFIHARSRTHIILIFLAPLFLLGLLSNLLLTLSICSQKALWTPKNILICQLSMVDLGGLVATNSYLFAMFARDTFRPITLPICLIQYYALNAHSNLLICTVTAMAIDRYCFICQPFHYERKITNRLTIRILSISWVFAAVYPMIYGLTFVGQKSCQLAHSCSFFCTPSSLEDILCSKDLSVYAKLYRLTIMALHLLGSFSLVGFSYNRILKVSRTMNHCNCSRESLTTAATHGLVLAIFYASLVFFIVTGSLEVKDPLKENLLSTLRAISDLVYFNVPSIFNPIIYGLRNRDIRAGVIKLLRLQHILGA